MSWKGSKVSRGPDEDGEHWQKPDQRKHDRMVAKQNRLNWGRASEPQELEERQVKFNRMVNAAFSRLHNDALDSLRQTFSNFDGKNCPQVVIQAGKETEVDVNNNGLVSTVKISVPNQTKVFAHVLAKEEFIIESYSLMFDREVEQYGENV